MARHLLAVLLGYCMVFGQASAAERQYLQDVELLHDESGMLTLEQLVAPDAAARFSIGKAPPSYPAGALWLRLNGDWLGRDGALMLEVGRWWVGSIDAFLVAPGAAPSPLAPLAREGYFTPHVFRVPAGQAAGADVYLRMSSRTSVPTGVAVWQADAFLEHLERRRLAVAGALGAMGACLLLLLGYSLPTRDPAAAWLALAVAGTACYVALDAGALPASWLAPIRGHMAVLNPLYTLPISIGALGALRFVFPLAAHLPRLAGWLRVGQLVLAALWLAGPVLSYQLGLGRWLIQMANGAILLVASVYLISAIVMLMRGYRSAVLVLALLLPMGAAGLAAIPWVGRALPVSFTDLATPLLPLLTTLLGVALLGSRLLEVTVERRRLREEHRLRDREVQRELERTVRKRTMQAEKARLRAEKLARVKERFMAAISHDLRTPLATVVGLADVAGREYAGLGVAEQQRMLRRASRYMLDVIEDLTLFERLEDGAERAVANRFSLGGLAGDVEALLQERARDAGVELSMSAEEAAADVVSDRRYLARILVNLVSNALAATPEGGRVQVRLALARTAPSGAQLQLAVEDSGRGLDGKALAALRRGALPGHGFTVVRELVDALHGELAITSTPGSGTCVTVVVPVETASEAGGLSPAPPALVAEQRILLVEDVVENQLIARALLESLGHTVATAGTLAECRRWVQEDTFDTLLLDRQLPDGDGLAALKSLRALCRRGGYYPRFVLVTADASAEARDDAYTEGFDALLTKPFSTEQLADALSGGAGRLPEVAAEGHRNYLDLLPPELQAEVLQGFAATAQEVADALSEAVRKGDVQRALAASHRLVGSASMASFSRLADGARRFNENLKASGTIDSQAVQRLLRELQAARGQSVVNASA